MKVKLNKSKNQKGWRWALVEVTHFYKATLVTKNAITRHTFLWVELKVELPWRDSGYWVS